MNCVESRSRVDEAVIFGSCRINRLRFGDDLLLLVSSEQDLQYAHGWFYACNLTAM